MKEDNSGRDDTVVEIISIDLRHTNGCTGDNQLVNKSIRKRRGRNYSDVGLNHLKTEVKAGRYTTHDVKSWLNDQGMKDATLREATNLRYRLMKDKPVKGYEFDEKDSAELGAMEDYLFNEDLAREIMAGAKESVDNLRIVHKGLKYQVKGYDYRITTDSENRFSGTVWMTGRMRARLRRYGIFLFLDDSRSGINSSGFCFWNVVVINEEGKVYTVMGAMTMGASNEAVEWLLKMMVEMCPEVADICIGTMSDLGVREEPVSKALPNVRFFGACTWHIMTIDFPKNLGHIPSYEEVKSYVYNNLVRNTSSKDEWEMHLQHACRTWPAAAKYLQELAREKHRWGAPWRLEHFTCGYEASSPVEGSFSSFQRAIGDSPKSFVGVVQTHVKKDIEKTQEEERLLVNAQIRAQDVNMKQQRSAAANACAEVYSEYITNNFEKTNQDAQDYVSALQQLNQDQILRGVTAAHHVSRRIPVDTNNPPRPPRIVEVISGVKYCSCLKDINRGRPCPHIQCVNTGGFESCQFSPHWKLATDVEEDLAVIVETTSAADSDADNVGNVDDTDISNTFNARNPFGDADDGIGQFGLPTGDVASMPSLPSSEPVRRPVVKKKKLDSKQKYTNIIQEAKQLANIASQDNTEDYHKLIAVLKWLRTNVQNRGGEEIVAASADYLGVKRRAADMSGADNEEILAPLLKKTAGATSTNRKKPSVEMSVANIQTCKFCGCAHRITHCAKANALGKRLTKSNWQMVELVPELDEEPPPLFDTVVPSDAMILQIVGCVTKSSKIYKAHVYLHGVEKKESPPSVWMLKDTIDNWTSKGTSQAHYVCVVLKDK